MNVYVNTLVSVFPFNTEIRWSRPEELIDSFTCEFATFHRTDGKRPNTKYQMLHTMFIDDDAMNLIPRTIDYSVNRLSQWHRYMLSAICPVQKNEGMGMSLVRERR